MVSRYPFEYWRSDEAGVQYPAYMSSPETEDVLDAATLLMARLGLR